MHPLWPQTGGFCYIDLPHVHNKPPTDFRVYRAPPPDNTYLFVGDPVALGYDGPKFGYFGPHPLAKLESAKSVSAGPPGKDAPMYCYLRGPHFHAQPPEAGAAFVSQRGVYWFTGKFSAQFDAERHNIWMNDAPVLTKYHPPSVTLADAPEGYVLPATVAVPVVNPPAAPVDGKTEGKNGKDGKDGKDGSKKPGNTGAKSGAKSAPNSAPVTTKGPS